MSGESIEGAWAKRPDGNMERKVLYPTGMLRVEQAKPRMGQVIYKDSFTNASRRLSSFPPIDNDKAQFMQKLLLQSEKPRIYFLSEDGSALQNVELKDANNIDVLVRKTPDASVDQPGIDDTNSNLILGYQKGQQVKLKMRAEYLISEDRVLPVKQALLLLVKAVEDTDLADREVSLEVTKTSLQDAIEYVGEDSPLIEKAGKTASALFTGVIFEAFDDVLEGVETGALLEKIGFREELQKMLINDFTSLRTDDYKQVFNEYGGPKAYMAIAIHGILKFFSTNESSFASPLVKVEKFDDTSFTDSEGVVHSYGDEIIVQDSKYKLTREGNGIRVVCSSNSGQARWKAGFPLEIPDKDFDFIVERGGDPDPNKDFREIKPKLQFEFEGAAT